MSKSRRAPSALKARMPNSSARKSAAPRSAELAREVAAALAGDPAEAAARAFAEQAAEDAIPDELPELSTTQLAANLADFWRFGATRRGRKPLVRVRQVLEAEEPPFDRLEIVQDDAPFLVDSVMGEIAEQGLSVRAMVHPLIEVRRDGEGQRIDGEPNRRESMIQVILEDVGPDREAALDAGVKATLADVHAAVADFTAMLQLLSRTLADLRERPGKATPEEIAFLSWLEAQQFVFLGARVYEFPMLANGDY
ncbi:MAG: NAD-specific glutamate dehydrogenase protein, partial [Phenylobacterium sp.]|nr:NAD-specific glutamate dehydrogenase protein [Phenylobacterium sp.]